jgi:hypothetical protein
VNHVVILNGKMTTSWRSWARKTFPDAHNIDILDESRYQALIANGPAVSEEAKKARAFRPWLVRNVA